MKIFAPGRVNLIGDHTDYTDGLVFPMAIQHGITMHIERSGDHINLLSDMDPEPINIALPVANPRQVDPLWGRYVAGVAFEMRATRGITGRVSSDLPIAGLSSSAALEIATALALGFAGTPIALAELCQRAEHAGSGVRSGIMDQLASAGGIAGKAMLIDCHTRQVIPTSLPSEAEVVVVHSGQSRQLVNTEYGCRREQTERAEQAIGPLRLATLDRLTEIRDSVIRSRARHVISENRRVREFVAALDHGDLAVAGELMNESHRSLALDFEVSTAILDDLVGGLQTTAGVYGARLTGAGFGGAVVALCQPGALAEGFVALASDGALQHQAMSGQQAP